MKPLITFLITSLLLVSCVNERDNSTTVETFGIITESVKLPDGNYACTLTYHVTKSTAYNHENELIQGELSQHIFGLNKLAVEGQKIKLRYNLNEPIDYQLLEKIRYQ